jgi:hypothetical protein
MICGCVFVFVEIVGTVLSATSSGPFVEISFGKGVEFVASQKMILLGN